LNQKENRNLRKVWDMEVSTEAVRELRDRTSAGMLDCKKALIEAEGDIEKAIETLRRRGIQAAEKKRSRVATEGVVQAYVHHTGRIGALVELNCETDFVAKNEDFRELAHELAMQVAAMTPLYVNREEVPEDVVNKQIEMFEESEDVEGKPDEIKKKIVNGKMEKWYKEVCLLDQPHFKDEDLTITDLINEAVAKIGENIVVSRFSRLSVGE
jgi:elongation factor Ts